MKAAPTSWTGCAFEGFPGWRPGSASEAEPTPKNWLDDLDDLDGGEDVADDHSEASEPHQPGRPYEESPGGVWPDDVLYAVLSKLGSLPSLLCAARAVSVRWRECASSDAFWCQSWGASASDKGLDTNFLHVRPGDRPAFNKEMHSKGWR